MIVADNLSRTYKGKIETKALKGVSFTIAHGEFIAIIGRSGSGKSTLLHQLSLIDNPTGGSLHMDDIDVLALSDAAKTRFRLENFGYVFQEYALIHELTAHENVYLPAMALARYHHVDYKQHAIELLKLVNLEHRIHHYPTELSGGEQQRVAIARALINNPRVLFADEPTANLDTTSSKTVLEMFVRLKKELGQTIIMVTHEPDDIKYVDRVISLSDGLIEPEQPHPFVPGM